MLCADAHVGYSQPIGGAVAYPEHISPSGVGYDIACGKKAARTGVLVADEAPAAYKRLDAVLAAHGDTIEILHRLTPIGVAMAAADTFDPYKD